MLATGTDDFQGSSGSFGASFGASGSRRRGEPPLVAHNRLRDLGNFRYEYDTLGRTTQKEDKNNNIVWNYKYNCENQLTEVFVRSRVGGFRHIRYQYDALGRRIGKTDGRTETRFLWDGMQLLRETGEERISTYIYEPDSYVPLARLDTKNPDWYRANNLLPPKDNEPDIYYFQCNASGMPEEMTDADGNIVWRARYSTWGKVVFESTSKHAPKGFEQNLRMQGQYHDRDSGLYYNTFRYYDADSGRFTTEDPIGLAGGDNLYQYAPNPLVWIDPWGWSCLSSSSGNRGRTKAMQDLKRNGFKLVGEEITMKVNGVRIRADFVYSKNNRLYVFEVKHGTGTLTRNQRLSGVFDMTKPANTTIHLGGGTIKTGQGTTGIFTVATGSAKGELLGGRGAIGEAIFNVLRYK